MIQSAIVKVKERQNVLFFGLLMIAVIVAKAKLLYRFGCQFVGSDDLIFWLGARDYSRGIFHEPYYYGQNYNVMSDALFAVPLLWAGVPLHVAVPMATVFLGLFPFFLFAWVAFRKGFHTGAIGILVVLLFMSIEYDMLTTMPRGFVGGLFFMSFLIFPLFRPNATRSFIIFGFMVGLGYCVNPNALLVAFPVGCFLWLSNWKNRSFYVLAVVSALPWLLVQYAAQQLYINEPERLVHFMWDLEFDWVALWTGFGRLDKYFGFINPMFVSIPGGILFLIFTAGVALFWIDWKKAVSILAAVVFALAMMGINKVNQDHGSLFLSSSRMFLGLPIVLGLSVLWLSERCKSSMLSNSVITGLALAMVIVKVDAIPKVVKHHVESMQSESIAVIGIDDFRERCGHLRALTERFHPDLIVFHPSWRIHVPDMEYLNYGCSLLNMNEVPTVMTVFDRRTWVFWEEKEAVRQNILFYNVDVNRPDSLPKTIDFHIPDYWPPVVVVRNNQRPLSELMLRLDIQYRRSNYK